MTSTMNEYTSSTTTSTLRPRDPYTFTTDSATTNKTSKETNTIHNLQIGDWHPPVKGDLRGPCPLVNTLANHGYIPRNGRNVTRTQLNDAFAMLGIGALPTRKLVDPSFVEFTHEPYEEGGTNHEAYTLIYPPNNMTKGFRHTGQTHPEEKDVPVIHLDQIGRHNCVEHDISMTRRDYAQGDCISKDDELVANLLDTAADGTTFYTGDFVTVRHNRIKEQMKDNPDLVYGFNQRTGAKAEIALVQTVFGRGFWYGVPLSYMKALFQDERLPREEGWIPRQARWYKINILEMLFIGIKAWIMGA